MDSDVSLGRIWITAARPSHAGHASSKRQRFQTRGGFPIQGRYTLFGTVIRGVMASSGGVWCPEINLSMIAKLETSIPTHIHHLTPATGVRAQALPFSMDMAPHVPPSFLKTLACCWPWASQPAQTTAKGPCHQAAAFPSHRTQQVCWRVTGEGSD